MKTEDVRKALGLPETFEFPEAQWAVSQETFDSERRSFLSPEFVADACHVLQMDADLSRVFLESLRRLRSHEALLRLAWHAHCVLFRFSGENTSAVPGPWPMLPPAFGPASALFYAFVLLSGLPCIETWGRKRGIPLDITLATLKDFELWLREYKSLHGRWGLDQFGWLINHFKGRVHALGRLQFMFSPFPFDFHVCRHRTTGRVVLLAGDGMLFRADGQFDGANDVRDPDHAWTAEYRKQNGRVTGYPISPRRGCAIRQPMKLDLSEWNAVLEKGDPVIGVHIPATGPLTHLECQESYRSARTFFPKYFPEYRFRAFDCYSWLLDAQLEDYLPPSSNIVQFLGDFYLLPIPGANDHQTIERVFGFGVKAVDPDTAPQDTALRRAVLEHMRNGGRWRQGGGVIFPEDIDRMPQVYRKTYAE